MHRKNTTSRVFGAIKCKCVNARTFLHQLEGAGVSGSNPGTGDDGPDTPEQGGMEVPDRSDAFSLLQRNIFPAFAISITQHQPSNHPGLRPARFLKKNEPKHR